MPLLHQRNSIFGSYPQCNRYRTLPSKTEATKIMQPPKNIKQVQAFLGLVGYCWKFIKNFAQITKLLATLTCHDAKFDRTLDHSVAFISLKGALIQAPILHYPDPSKQMHLMVPMVLNYHRNTMASKYQSHFFHIHSQTVKMEHPQVRSPWCLLLCHDQIELLSPGIWYYCVQWPQTHVEVS